MRTIVTAGLLCLMLGACSDSENQALNQESANPFPKLPTNNSEKVTLHGEMAFWMYEGSAGCYGAITDGSTEVSLWISADNCGEKEYAENEKASVEIIFNPDNQYGPEKTYTITGFK